jgi:hypothetical protein
MAEGRELKKDSFPTHHGRFSPRRVDEISLSELDALAVFLRQQSACSDTDARGPRPDCGSGRCARLPIVAEVKETAHALLLTVHTECSAISPSSS